jgi:hypothetical protein
MLRQHRGAGALQVGGLDMVSLSAAAARRRKALDYALHPVVGLAAIGFINARETTTDSSMYSAYVQGVSTTE